MTNAVFQNDFVDHEKTSSDNTEDGAVKMEDSCEVGGRDAAHESSVASETTAQQTKPKKMNKKQMLAEQRRKDRVCTVCFAAVKCVCVSYIMCAFIVAFKSLWQLSAESENTNVNMLVLKHAIYVYCVAV